MALGLLAHREVEHVTDAIARATQAPQHEVMMRRALHQLGFRRRLPLTAGREHVENCVQDLSHCLHHAVIRRTGRQYNRPHQRPPASVR